MLLSSLAADGRITREKLIDPFAFQTFQQSFHAKISPRNPQVRSISAGRAALPSPAWETDCDRDWKVVENSVICLDVKKMQKTNDRNEELVP